MPIIKSKNFLVEHWLSIARDKHTQAEQFRAALENIASILFTESISEVIGLNIKTDIKTPLKKIHVRFIDQKKSVKYDKLMSRAYESLKTLHVILLFDLGRSALGKIEGSPKIEYLLAAGFSLGQLALQRKDTLSIAAFTQNIHYQRSHIKNPEALYELYKGHPEFYAREVESSYEILTPLVQRLAGQRSLIIIFSDLTRPSVQESLLPVVHTLSRKHMVFSVGILEENMDLKTRIKGFDLNLDQQNNLNTENLTPWIYRYWIENSFQIFQSRLAQLGSGALHIPHSKWLGAISHTYESIRNSLRV